MPGGFGSRVTQPSVTTPATPVGGGFGSRATGPAAVSAAPTGGGFGSRSAPPAKKSGGGILGSIEHAVGDAAHIGSKIATGIPTDFINAPGQMIKIAGDAIHSPLLKAPGGWSGLAQQWEHPMRPVKGDKLSADVQGMMKGTAKSLTDPHYMAQHPDQTVLSLFALATGGASAVSRLGYAGDALKAASAASKAGDTETASALRTAATKAVASPLHKPPVASRLIKVGDDYASLHPSQNPLIRAVQKVHDSTVQKAITEKPDSKLASYGTKRVGISNNEMLRRAVLTARAPAQALSKAGKGLDKFEQAALRLTSENATPKEAIAFHEEHMATNPKAHAAQVSIAKTIQSRGLLTKDDKGNVVVNAEKAPYLAKVDKMLEKGSAEREAILEKTGQMSPEGLAARRSAPNVVRATGQTRDFNRPPGQLGLFDKEGVREGRNYVPEYSSEIKPAKSPIAKGGPNVIGKARGVVSSKRYSGQAKLAGESPDNTTGLVARQMERAVRYLQTDKFRRNFAKMGSPTKQSHRDVLLNTQELKNAEHIPDTLRASMGERLLTHDELAGHKNAFEAWRQQLVHGLHGEHKADDLGTAAPKGWVWVDRNVLGSLGKKGPGPLGGVGKTFDTVNSATTAATVYLKLSHVITRSGTNLLTNMIQGSARPVQIAKSFKLWHALSDEEKSTALAQVGHGGYTSIPAESENAIGAFAKGGAQFWAHFFDAPFRFNSLAYEARKVGIDTPEKFKQMLDDMAHPEHLTPEAKAKLDDIAREADRASISYGRMGEAEKATIQRVLWFYPWMKGSTGFIAHTLTTHPFKSAALGQIGAQGAQQSLADLGPLPSYERGLFKVGGTPGLPTTMNLNTINPFSTGAQVLQALIHGNHPLSGEQPSGFYTPAMTAVGEIGNHLNPFGAASKTGTLPSVLHTLTSGTWEAQVLDALRTHGNQGNKMFPVNSPLREAIYNLFTGSARPRTLNQAEANYQAYKERINAGR